MQIRTRRAEAMDAPRARQLQPQQHAPACRLPLREIYRLMHRLCSRRLYKRTPRGQVFAFGRAAALLTAASQTTAKCIDDRVAPWGNCLAPGGRNVLCCDNPAVYGCYRSKSPPSKAVCLERRHDCQDGDEWLCPGWEVCSSKKCMEEARLACYAQRYTDLWRAYCKGVLATCNWSQLQEHWEQHGRVEGRILDCSSPRPPPPPVSPLAPPLSLFSPRSVPPANASEVTASVLLTSATAPASNASLGENNSLPSLPRWPPSPAPPRPAVARADSLNSESAASGVGSLRQVLDGELVAWHLSAKPKVVAFQGWVLASLGALSLLSCGFMTSVLMTRLSKKQGLQRVPVDFDGPDDFGDLENEVVRVVPAHVQKSGEEIRFLWLPLSNAKSWAELEDLALSLYERELAIAGCFTSSQDGQALGRTDKDESRKGVNQDVNLEGKTETDGRTHEASQRSRAQIVLHIGGCQRVVEHSTDFASANLAKALSFHFDPRGHHLSELSEIEGRGIAAAPLGQRPACAHDCANARVSTQLAQRAEAADLLYGKGEQSVCAIVDADGLAEQRLMLPLNELHSWDDVPRVARLLCEQRGVALPDDDHVQIVMNIDDEPVLVLPRTQLTRLLRAKVVRITFGYQGKCVPFVSSKPPRYVYKRVLDID